MWLPSYEKHFIDPLSEPAASALQTISASTIDRLLAPKRRWFQKTGLATTKPGSLLKQHIPYQRNVWDETRPGFFEIDTVAHCGSSTAGTYVHTVGMVDLATAFSVHRALWGKGEHGVVKVLPGIEEALPFRVLGLDGDNGSELINWHMYKYLLHRKRPVQYTRSREYQPNDNAHIEEKNWSIVRQYLGYQRFEDRAMVDMLNDLYEHEWFLLLNFFIPSMKLVSKTRINGRVVKHHDDPRTPYQRVLESAHIAKETKRRLKRQFETLDPFHLQEIMQQKIKAILALTVQE
jgi:hypothetical protein